MSPKKRPADGAFCLKFPDHDWTKTGTCPGCDEKRHEASQDRVSATFVKHVTRCPQIVSATRRGFLRTGRKVVFLGDETGQAVMEFPKTERHLEAWA